MLMLSSIIKSPAISSVRQSQNAAAKEGRSGVEIVAVACDVPMTGKRRDARLCVSPHGI